MRIWDARARSYDWYRRLPLLRAVTDQEMTNLAELLHDLRLQQCRVLDVGTGTGAGIELVPASARLFAADRSRNMLALARRRRRRAGFFCADAIRLPLKSDTFRLVMAIGLFEYQRDRLQLLEELQRVTMAGGHILITYSRKHAFNLIRLFWGKRIYMMTPHSFARLAEIARLARVAEKRSLIQSQVLLCKKESCD